jgi:hypothetical protein
MDLKAKSAAEIQDSIRQILGHDWNPIGFNDALPEDKYDSYIALVTGFWQPVGPKRS